MQIGHSEPPQSAEMGRQIVADPYNWPHDASLSPDTTALIVIDMQRDFLEPGGYLTNQGYDPTPLRSTISQVLTLLETFTTNNYPTIFTRESHRPDLSTLSSREHFRSRNNPSHHGIGDPSPSLGRSLVRGQPGCGIIPELTAYVHENDVRNNVIDKPGRSAFAHTELELILRNRGIRNLVICGVTTDVCVSGTMREGNDRGFDCLIVEDACAAGTEGGHRETIESVKGEGGIFGSVARTEEVVRGLEASG